jgi:tRNA wybutosine-synthesizing protein 1
LKSVTGVSPAPFLADDGKSSSCGKIVFASQTGNSRRLAEKLQKELSEDANVRLDLVDPAAYEPEDLVKERLVILVASTWEDGKAPPNASFLARWLEESSKDFRVGSGLLRECRSVLLLSCKGSM